ncbi:MAG: beta-lactamase family protein [Candidatus Sumerlaeia bacterium]|nr:beta-lactamase family protein [Candidatus Sumerlaeia bacterium]
MMRMLVLLAVLLLASGCRQPGATWRVSDLQAGFAPSTMRILEHRVRQEDQRGDIASASIAIYREGALVYQDNFGRIFHGGEPVEVDGYTLFDIASLSKPLAGARLAHDYLRLETIDGETAALVEAIVQSRTGAHDEELLPFVSSILANPGIGLEETHLLVRMWLRQLRDSHREVREIQWEYSNYAWGILPLLPFARPDLAPALNGRIVDFDQPHLTYRPRPDEMVSATSFNPETGRKYRVGRPYDPLADFIATRMNLPPMHSGLFGHSIGIGDMVSSWIKLYEAGDPFANWFFEAMEPIPDADGSGRLVHQTRGGMRIATEPPHAPPGAPRGRFLYHDGYTGCLLWIDRQSGVVLVMLSNAVLDGSHEEWALFVRDFVRILQRGIDEADNGWRGRWYREAE